MRFLRTLSVGDKFRVAHSKQKSLNGRTMPREQVYVVKKVFPQSPNLSICLKDQDDQDGFFSLGPMTPVLYQKEFDPTDEAVIKFLGKGSRKRCVGIRLKWDGKSSLKGVVYPQLAALVKAMFVFGKKEYLLAELKSLLNTRAKEFYTGPMPARPSDLFSAKRRMLVENGLIEEIVDDAPVTQAMVDANLQETE